MQETALELNVGKDYTTIIRVVNRVDYEDSPLNSYCSASCTRDCIRVEYFR